MTTHAGMPAPSTRLADKVILVAGAGSSAPGWSIGRACAVAMARHGAKVVALDFDLRAAQETVQEITAIGGEAIAVQADVGNADQMGEAIKRCIDTYGRIDVFHANAGISKTGGPEDISMEDWQRIHHINVDSLLIASKLVLPHMRAQGSGAFVTVASIAGMRYLGYPHLAYSVSKAALIHFTRMIAQQYAGDGIRANVVVPGLIDTPRVQKNVAHMFDPSNLDNAKAARDKQVPMGRMGTAWEVANAVVFLASDEASYITGTELVVDGGITGKYV